jgi:hypothetical protein
MTEPAGSSIAEGSVDPSLTLGMNYRKQQHV